MINEQFLKLVLELNRKTISKEIKWQARTPPDVITAGTNVYITLYMSYQAKDVAYGIYEFRYQDFNPDTEQHYWSEGKSFAILSFSGQIMYSYEEPEYVGPINDLFNSARLQQLNFGQLLRNL